MTSGLIERLRKAALSAMEGTASSKAIAPLQGMQPTRQALTGQQIQAMKLSLIDSSRAPLVLADPVSPETTTEAQNRSRRVLDEQSKTQAMQTTESGCR